MITQIVRFLAEAFPLVFFCVSCALILLWLYVFYLILLKYFKLLLIDCISRLKYIALVILHYQVNL